MYCEFTKIHAQSAPSTSTDLQYSRFCFQETVAAACLSEVNEPPKSTTKQFAEVFMANKLNRLNNPSGFTNYSLWYVLLQNMIRIQQTP